MERSYLSSIEIGKVFNLTNNQFLQKKPNNEFAFAAQNNPSGREKICI
jgi:hypothetical protein